jgi:hypothetical protein
VLDLTPPELAPLSPVAQASAIALLADLLLEAARDAALVPSAGPALIDDVEEEG